jgi:hypothetical protein
MSAWKCKVCSHEYDGPQRSCPLCHKAEHSLAAPTGSATSVYDPVKCLQEEVSRFFKTNTFTPMEVTNFYAQARVVLDVLGRAQDENKRLKSRVVNLEKQVDKLETALVDDNV